MHISTFSFYVHYYCFKYFKLMDYTNENIYLFHGITVVYIYMINYRKIKMKNKKIKK